MKRFISILSVALCLVAVVMAGSDYIPFYNEEVSISANETNTYDSKVSGEVEAIVLNFSGVQEGAFTGTVAIATTDDGPLGTARTIFSKALSADASYSVRIPISSTAGTEVELGTNGYARIQLYSDILTMTTSSFNNTNVNVRATVILNEE